MKRLKMLIKKNITTVVLLFFLMLIRCYQLFISPLKPCCCRYVPTCSAYAKDAFLLHGPIKGAMLTLKRILRCHPWGGYGYDPVPLVFNKKNEGK